MQWLSRAGLAAAVSNACGLGTIAAASFYSDEELRREIRLLKSLTDKPFAVNFTLMPTRRPIVWEAYINAALEEGTPVIETSGRSPEPYMDWLKASGVTVIHKASRIRDALTAQRLGADAVIIVGYEAGGHPGMEETGTMVQLPAAVDALDIPVIAAGGFGDGRGLAAALSLGAQGIVMGTRFMASGECDLHPSLKKLLVDTPATGTLIIERSIRNAARVLRTSFSEAVLEMEQRGAALVDLIPLLDGERIRRCYENGTPDDSILYCGQSVGLIDSIMSAGDIIETTVAQAETIRRETPA